MPILRINRKSEFFYKLRNYDIHIDGIKCGKVKNGEIKDFEVAEGKHTVRARVDWAGSEVVTLNFKEGDIKSLEVGGLKYANEFVYTGIILFVSHFVLSYLYKFNYLLILMGVVLIAKLYFLTIGRKTYLALKKMD